MQCSLYALVASVYVPALILCTGWIRTRTISEKIFHPTWTVQNLSECWIPIEVVNAILLLRGASSHAPNRCSSKSEKTPLSILWREANVTIVLQIGWLAKQ